MESLEKIEIKKVYGPTTTGAAVLLGNEAKTFVVFIGFHEAAALMRELKKESPIRPLTHDLMQSVLLGFDLTIKQIVITKIVDNAFCATLILEQLVKDKDGAWAGRRNEVRIDARPSDCLVLAVKNDSEIFVTQEVFSQVQNFAELSAKDEVALGSLFGSEEETSPFSGEDVVDLPEDFLRRREPDVDVEFSDDEEDDVEEEDDDADENDTD